MAATAGQQQLLAVVERADIWHCVAAYLGGVDMWRARRVCLGFRAACEAELRCAARAQPADVLPSERDGRRVANGGYAVPAAEITRPL
jgi:hypothetical protein